MCMAGFRLVFTVCLFLMAAPPDAQSEEGIVFAGPDYPPYLFGDMGGAIAGGIALEIVTKIFNELGFSVKTQIVPWSRAVGMAERGQSDLLFPARASDSGSAFLLFTEPVYYSKGLVFYALDQTPDFRWRSLRDFSKKTIGFWRKHSPGDAFEAAVKTYDIRVIRLNEDAAIFKLINFQRIDFAILDARHGHSLLDLDAGWKKTIKASAKPVYEVPVVMGISKKSMLAGRLGQINDRIRKMHQSGQINGILGGS